MSRHASPQTLLNYLFNYFPSIVFDRGKDDCKDRQKRRECGMVGVDCTSTHRGICAALADARSACALPPPCATQALPSCPAPGQARGQRTAQRRPHPPQWPLWSPGAGSGCGWVKRGGVRRV
eukprot:356678-Chlamydomonas_euryale.AAC.3